MNFFKELKNEPIKEKNKLKEKSNVLFKELKNKPIKENKEEKIFKELKNEPINEDEKSNFLFKRGDFIQIIGTKNKYNNCYKGYYGEIREYLKYSDYAYVILDAISVSPLVKVHVNQLKKVTF